jgi:Tfp pilus assembly protein PilF
MLKDQLLDRVTAPQELLSSASAPPKPGGLPSAGRWTGERLRIAMLLAVVVLVYGNSLLNQFTLDDGLYIMRNPQVTHLSLRELFAPNKLTNVFRPFTFATLALNWALGAAHPLGYHVFNILLHAGVTWLLYLLLQAILGSSLHGKAAALAAALLFAVHPIHTEAVASVAGRPELLAAAFLLAAWLLHLRDREFPALLCFVLALLSKESAVVFLALLLIGDYARGKWKPGLRYARVAGVTLLYIALLWEVQGRRFGQAGIAPLDNPLAALPAGWRFLNALRVAWKYVGLHFYPATLSCDYSFNQIPVYVDWRHTLPAALAALAALGAWIWAIRTRQRGLALAGGIYLAGFAVTANILVPTGTIMGERLAYLPSAGFCLLLALAWCWLRDRQRALAWGLFVVVVGSLGLRTAVRNRDWKDDLSLFSAAVRAAPNSAKAHADLAGQYMAGRQLDLAQAEFQASLRIYPGYPDALASYGLLQFWRGNYQDADRMMERALQTSARDNPNYDFMAVNLAALWMQTGDKDDALQLLNREIAEAPGYARAWSNRAVLRYQNGERQAARADAEAALRLDRDSSQAQNLLRLLGTRSAASN